MVKLLVNAGANFEGKAIIYASVFGNIDIVKYLVWIYLIMFEMARRLLCELVISLFLWRHYNR